MSRKSLGSLIALGGVVLLIVCLLADMLNLGADPEFGPNQIRGTVAGVVAVVLGIVLIKSPTE